MKVASFWVAVAAVVVIAGTVLACTTPPVAYLEVQAEFRADEKYHTMTGMEVVFDARKSCDADTGNYITKYEFDFSYDAQTGFQVDETECLEDCGAGGRDHYFDGMVKHSFAGVTPTPVEQEFTVALRVTDNTGRTCVSVATCTVVVHKGVSNTFDSDYGVIQDAIDDASSGDEIWVAPGVYEQNLTIDSGKDGIALRSKDPSDPEVVAKTVLYADGGAGPVVQFNDGITTDTKLAGFTVSGARDVGGGNYWTGVGIYCYGGSPDIEGCVIRHNFYGLYSCYGGSPVVNRCVFYRNLTGGGMANEPGYYGSSGSVAVANSVFCENRHEVEYGPYAYGGAIYNWNYSLTVTNCTFEGNAASYGGAIFSGGTGAALTAKNCICWSDEGESGYEEICNSGGSATVSYCGVDGAKCGGVTPTNGVSAAPLFTDAGSAAGADNIFGTDDDGLRLAPGSAGSPCIEKGDDSAAPSTDITGRGRVDVPYIANGGGGEYSDMGAYETCTVWFVKRDGTGSEDGHCWASAYEELQGALGSISFSEGDEVWVAAPSAGGGYKPSTSSRGESFVLVEGVGIYGGFAGDEVGRAARDWRENGTVLSGDIGGDDGDEPPVYSDNSYHVVTGVDGGLLDGFWIEGGRADGLVQATRRGGGLDNSDGSPVVENCVFSENVAIVGGAVYNGDGSAEFRRCVFVGNVANVSGGAIANEGVTSNGRTENCVFTDNTAGVVDGAIGSGGAMVNVTQGSHPVVIHCTVYDNYAIGTTYPRGGGVYNLYASPVVSNSIIWNNHDGTAGVSAADEVYNAYAAADPSFRCCDVNECLDVYDDWKSVIGNDGGGNMDENPDFTSPDYPKGPEVYSVWMTDDDGLQLGPASGLIDKADGDEAPSRDIRGHARVDIDLKPNGWGTPDYVDIGAYELDSEGIGTEYGMVGGRILIMCWIDESNWYFSAEYDSVKEGIYLDDLDYYRAQARELAVLSGCLIPRTYQPGFYHSAPWWRNIMPRHSDGSIYNEPAGISVEAGDCTRTDGVENWLELAEIVADYDRIRTYPDSHELMEPDVVVLIVDHSGSLSNPAWEGTHYDIEPGYSAFKSWLADPAHYGGWVIAVDNADSLDPDCWGSEDWLRRMGEELEKWWAEIGDGGIILF